MPKPKLQTIQKRRQEAQKQINPNANARQIQMKMQAMEAQGQSTRHSKGMVQTGRCNDKPIRR